MSKEAPLTAEIKDGALRIGIGIDTLAFAFERGDYNNPFNSASGEFNRIYRVDDTVEFARDVLRVLLAEGEDGSNAITNLLDGAYQRAVDEGSTGIVELEPGEESRRGC